MWAKLKGKAAPDEKGPARRKLQPDASGPSASASVYDDINFDQIAKKPWICSLPQATRYSFGGAVACALTGEGYDQHHVKWAQEFLKRFLEQYLKLPCNSFMALYPLSQLPETANISDEEVAREWTPLASAANPAPFVDEIGGKEALWKGLRDLVVKCTASKEYDGRVRAIFKRLAHSAQLEWQYLTRVEELLAIAMNRELEDAKAKIVKKKETKKRSATSWAKVGAAAVGGGALLVFTGGLAAPALVAGIGALAGAGGVIGTSAAFLGGAVTMMGGVGGITLVFGATGAGLAGKKMFKRTKDLTGFEMKLIRGEKRLPVFVFVAGFLNSKDKTGHWTPFGGALHQGLYEVKFESGDLGMNLGEATEAATAAAVKAAEDEEERDQGGAGAGAKGTSKGGATIKEVKEMLKDAAVKEGPVKVVVWRMVKDGPAHEHGVVLGSTVIAINDTPISSLEDTHQFRGVRPLTFTLHTPSWEDTIGDDEEQATVAAVEEHGANSPRKAVQELEGKEENASTEEVGGGRGGGEGIADGVADIKTEVTEGGVDDEQKQEDGGQEDGGQEGGGQKQDSDSDDEEDIEWALPTGEQYALLWESSLLRYVGRKMKDFGGRDVAEYAATKALQTTVLSAVVLAAAWPVALLRGADAIDNPWTMASERAKMAGEALAELLLSREHGCRPVSLVGFSLGARVIFCCLQVIDV
jgi:hypothetical protein